MFLLVFALLPLLFCFFLSHFQFPMLFVELLLTWPSATDTCPLPPPTSTTVAFPKDAHG